MEVSLRDVLKAAAAAIPEDVHRPNIIIIGSLAAGYGLFRRDDVSTVRTKDVDCVLSPHISAVEKGKEVAEKLIAADGRHSKGHSADRNPRHTTVFPETPLSARRRVVHRTLTEPSSENKRNVNGPASTLAATTTRPFVHAVAAYFQPPSLASVTPSEMMALANLLGTGNSRMIRQKPTTAADLSAETKIWAAGHCLSPTVRWRLARVGNTTSSLRGWRDLLPPP